MQMEDSTQSHATQALVYALENHPQKVEVVELRRLVMESARQNPKRPAYLKLAVPDEVVKGLRGSGAESDLLLMVRVPREVLERRDSRIILPGDLR
jgi:hypothetical protein